MALMQCPECSHYVSDSANTCPNCGYSIQNYRNDLQERKRLEYEPQKRERQHIENLKRENQRLKDDIRKNLWKLNRVINTSINTGYSPRGIIQSKCVYEYHNNQLWISFCTGYLDDEHGRYDEGYVCWKCWEAYIDKNDIIRRKSDNKAFGEIGSFSLNDKVDNLSPHKYPCDKSDGCYIATAVYGTYDCPEVWTLRRFRDYTLKSLWLGRLFIGIYYELSPKLVQKFGENYIFKKVGKKLLDVLVKKLNKKGVSDKSYTDLP